MSTSYFYDEDASRWLAVRSDGIFSLDRGASTWTLAVHGSLRWDSLHQRIHVDRRWIEPISDTDAAALPELPDPTGASVDRWADNFDAELRVPVERHPRLAARLQGHGTQPVYVVLHEDLWETRFGDGRFHYLHDAHFDEARARAQVDALDGELSRGHLRTMSVRRDEDMLWIPDFTVEMFDHCRVRDILEKLESC